MSSQTVVICNENLKGSVRFFAVKKVIFCTFSRYINGTRDARAHTLHHSTKRKIRDFFSLSLAILTTHFSKSKENLIGTTTAQKRSNGKKLRHNGHVILFPLKSILFLNSQTKCEAWKVRLSDYYYKFLLIMKICYLF